MMRSIVPFAGLPPARSCTGADSELRRVDPPAQGFINFASGLPLPAFLGDAEGRFVWVNDAFAAFHHWHRLDAPPASLDGEYDLVSLQRYLREAQQVLSSGRPSSMSKGRSYHLRTDRLLYPQGYLFRLRGAGSGEPLVGNVFWDTTDQVTLARALSASELRFQTFLDHTPLCAVVKDELGRYAYANRAYLQATGQTRETLLGRTIEGPEDQVALFAELDARIRETGSPLTVALPFPAVEGQATATVYRFPLPQQDGSVHIGVIKVDASELLNARAALAQLQRRYHALVERAGIGIALLDLKGNISEANPAFCAMFGYRAAELVGRSVSVLAAPDEAGRHAPLWAEFADGRRYYQLDSHLIHRNRKSFLGRVTVSVVSDAELKPQLAIAMVEQLTHSDDAGAAVLPEHLRLTDTEITVLERLGAGQANQAIARALGMSRQAVTYHLTNLRRKLGSPGTRALPARAYALGLFVPGQWPPRVHHGSPFASAEDPASGAAGQRVNTPRRESGR